jgi:predicted HicB family RNase H-like nuclease
MPREKIDSRVQMQFRLASKVRERLRKEAARRQVSINFLMEKALDESLARWEKEKL